MGLGFKDWAAGDVPTAAEFDGYLQRQTVMVFSSATARDTALAGSLEEGMTVFTTDTDTHWYYTGSAWRVMPGTMVLQVSGQQAISASASNAALLVDIETRDLEGMTAAGSEVVTFTTGGLFAVSLRATHVSGSGSLTAVLRNVDGGNGLVATANSVSSATSPRWGGSVVALSDGETLELRATENLGATVTVDFDLRIARLGY